jgi:very-short-patch-repair endonuclease
VVEDRGIENVENKNQEIGNNTNNNLRIYKQKTIDNFIVDFYIPKYKLVIEVD